MSDLGTIYGDYGQQAAAAIKKRANQTFANQQSIAYGQQRGQRSLEDLSRKFQQGWNPTLSSYAKRGLKKSGITQGALLNFASDYQRNMDAQRQANAMEQNNLMAQDTQNEDDLQAYLAQLKFNKNRDILNTASDIAAIGAFGG